MKIANIDTCRSYATEEALLKALEKWGFASYRFVVVRNSEGRFTAIFPASEAISHGYLGLFAQKGFLTLG